MMKEVTDGHDVYDASNIFKAVVDQFQMIDLGSKAFICLDNNLESENSCNSELMSSLF